MNKLSQIPFLLPAFVLSIGIFLAGAVGAYAFYTSRTLDNTLSVTGSTKQVVTADSGKISFMITRRVPQNELARGYAELAKDVTTVKEFLSMNSIPVSADAFRLDPVYVEEIYYDSNFTGVREVNVRQSIEISSSDVKLIESLAQSVEGIATKGIYVTSSPAQYFYSKLSDLRVSLLGAALTDAKARAEQIAKSSGQDVGSLKAASSGVVQVLAPNSIEISDYGSYDTSSIEKEISVSVRATFFLK